MAWIDSAPLFLVGLAFFLIMLIGIEIGYRAWRWLRAKDGGSGGHEFLLTAALGLLSLLLGFTFSLALSRYDARRTLAVQEANAIGSMWLRAQLLRDPDKSRMSDLVRRYVDARIAWSQAASRAADLAPTQALQGQIWAVTGDVMRTEPSQPLARGLMDAVSQGFDLQAARTAARKAQIPTRVLDILVLYSVLSMMLLGSVLAAKGQRHYGATAVLLVLLTLALILILELDQPRTGAIQVSQQPLLDVKASMR